MSLSDPCLIRSRGPSGEPVVRLGMPLVDDYLEFLAGRCRPNTVLAAAYDLKVFFARRRQAAGGGAAGGRAGVHHRPAHRPRATARWLQPVERRGAGGVSTSTVRRRLSIVSGFFAYLQARGDVAANPVPRGLPTRRERSASGAGGAADAADPAAAADPDPGRGRRADRRAAHPPGPGDGRGDGARRAAPLRGPRAAAGGPAGRRAAGVHRRGQGRPPAAGPGLGAVLHRGRGLPRHRAARRRRTPTGCSWSSRAPTAGSRCRPRDWTRSSPAPGAGPGWRTRPATSCGTPA